ncbi:MAG: type III secretion system cytoplasmic ring protein SctQ, partial [Pseudomonadota bacterium]
FGLRPCEDLARQHPDLCCLRVTSSTLSLTAEVAEDDLHGLCRTQGVPSAPPLRVPLVEAALDGVLATIEGWLGDTVRIAVAHRADPAVRWLAIRLGGQTVCIRIGCTPDHLPKLAAMMRSLKPRRVRHLDVLVAFRLGRFLSDVGGIRTLEPGDVFLPEHADIDTGRVHITVADQIVGTGSADSGNIIIEEIRPMQDWQSNEVSETDSSVEASETPAELPIRVTFDIGTRTMSLADVSRLDSGMVLPLDGDVETCEVAVRANGARIASGRLVSLGTRLGVEISRVNSGA